MNHAAVKVWVQLTHPQAQLPKAMQPGDAGADLHACEATTVPAKGRALVAVGLALELPEGYRARLHSRSGLALKHGIEVGAGLIDQGFRDPIAVLLHNHGDADFPVAVGDRVAQLCIERSEAATFLPVEAVQPTGRSSGWGSSGS